MATEWKHREAPVVHANFTDRSGANLLKERIEAYWRERGYEIQVNLVEAPFTPAIRSARIDIRSELVNGWPRAARSKPVNEN